MKSNRFITKGFLRIKVYCETLELMKFSTLWNKNRQLYNFQDYSVAFGNQLPTEVVLCTVVARG